MFALSDDERVRSLLRAARFTDVLIEDVPVRFPYGDVDEYVASAVDTGGAFARAFTEASDEQRAAIEEELREAFGPFAADDGFVLTGVALVAIAR
jgi:hypothetical protein